MTIEQSKISSEAFFLYAETFLPDDGARTHTLRALQMCADGTSRFTPSVATYVFRRSKLSGVIADRCFPGSLALESTELYLTGQGFRDHITTDEFRAGLRSMYKETERLGAHLYWIGARPQSDMMHNIYRSDPEARPIATLCEKLFDPDVYKNTNHEDAAIVSLLCPVAKGQGANAIDVVDRIDSEFETISFIAFFHPRAQDLLRLFMVLPIGQTQSAQTLSAAVEPLNALSQPPGRVLGSCMVHRERQDLVEDLSAAFEGQGTDWEIRCDQYSGYVSHPQVSTEDTS